MTPILIRLAHDIDDALGGTACADALEASTADLSFVHWRFFADMLRAMPPATDDVQAVIDPVIAGMDRRGRGEDWPEAADAARAAAEAAAEAAAGFDGDREARHAGDEVGAWAAEAAKVAAAAWAAADADAALAAAAATFADVPRETQQAILLRLIREASE